MSTALLAETFLWQALSPATITLLDSTVLTRPPELGNPPRIYASIAPPDAQTFPRIIHQQQGGSDLTVNGTGFPRLISAQLYTIRIQGRTQSVKDLAAIDNWVDNALQATSYFALPPLGAVLFCNRIQQMTMREVVQNDIITTLLSIYQLSLQEQKTIGTP